jgi:hypothetical protein
MFITELSELLHVSLSMGMRKVWTATWKIALLLIAWGVLVAPLFLPVSDSLEAPVVRLYVEVTGAATLLAAVWILQYFVEHRRLVSLGFAREHTARSIAIFTLAGWTRWLPTPPVPFAALSLSALAMMANTITQEVLVRGYVRQTFEREFGPLSAVVLSAAFFTLLHAGAIRDVLPALNIFAAGLLLGVAYVATGNLWLPIGIHFGWNFLQGPLLGLAVSGQSVSSGWRMVEVTGPPLLTGGAFGIEGGIVALVVTIIATAITGSFSPREKVPRSGG